MWLQCFSVLQVSPYLARACFPLCMKTPKSLRHLNYVLSALCCQSLIESVLVCPEGISLFLLFFFFRKTIFLLVRLFMTYLDKGVFDIPCRDASTWGNKWEDDIWLQSHFCLMLLSIFSMTCCFFFLFSFSFSCGQADLICQWTMPALKKVAHMPSFALAVLKWMNPLTRNHKHQQRAKTQTCKKKETCIAWHTLWSFRTWKLNVILQRFWLRRIEPDNIPLWLGAGLFLFG